MMYPEVDSEGSPISATYAQTRMRWEPVAEVTQTKGDSETHPSLTPNDEFESSLNGATWDEDSDEWVVELQSPAGLETRRYTNLISAIGQLNVPKPPPVPGTDDFDGPCFHSSHWPADLDIAGIALHHPSRCDVARQRLPASSCLAAKSGRLIGDGPRLLHYLQPPNISVSSALNASMSTVSAQRHVAKPSGTF